ncbi:MAG: biotin attachment protein [Chloroflexi bacterium]|nr:biotin attachment protein [Chloroflexota bacterium]
MVKYAVHVAGREVEVAFDPRRPGCAWIDGVAVAADCQQVGSQPVFSLLVDGRAYELVVQDVPGEGLRIGVGGALYDVAVEDERARELARLAGRRGEAGGETPVKAPMPGLVVSVAVSPGDEVAAHQRLLILEAMKMENELRAPRAGRVRAVHVGPGEKVEQGRLLVVLD